MTVQTSTNVASFNGDGANKVFPVGYKFNSAADLVVTLIDDEAKTTQILTLNSDFTVAGAGDEEGGDVTLVVAPTAVQRLKVTRVVDILQLTDLRNQGKFYAEIHEDVFDLLIMIDQQQQTEIDDANAKSDEAVATANEANAKSDQAVAKAGQNLVDMQAQYDAFEQGASLVVIGDYASGLVVDGYNKVFRKDGEFYRAKAELTLPYPLNGDWAVDAPKFVSVGDAALRQELALADGAGMIGYQIGNGEIGSAAERLGREVYLTDFYLAPETSWSGAFQRAYDYLKALDSPTPGNAHQTFVGGVINIPKGRFEIDSKLTVNTWGVKIRGQGRASVVVAKPGFSGTEAFLFSNDPSAISDVGVENLSFEANDQAVSLARFVRCRDLMWAHGCTATYLNAPLFVLDRCEQWEIVRCFWMPYTVAAPTASGILLQACQEGRVSQCKMFGWDRDGLVKSTGYAIKAHQGEELRIEKVDVAFFDGGGLYQDRCNYVQVDKFQVEGSTRSLLVTSEATTKSATDNLYCNYSGLILDDAPGEINYSTGSVVRDFGSSSTMTFGAQTDRCMGSVSGGRGAIFVNDGVNNVMLSDAFGKINIQKGGFRIGTTGGRYDGEGNVILASVSGNTIQNSLIIQPTVAGFAKPLQVSQAWDSAETGAGFRLGGHRLWVDASGRLRIKNGAPTSDTDGVVVGSQT